MSTPEKEFENKMFPLNIIFSEENESNEYSNVEYSDEDSKENYDLKTRSGWIDACKEYYNKKDAKKIKNIFSKFDKIITKLYSYTIPVVSLNSDTEIDAVCKIFEKVNSSNQPLTGFDLVVAIYTKNNFDLKEDWRKLQKEF